MRGSIALVSLCILMAIAGSASATAPLPAIEKNLAPPGVDVGYMRDEFIDKNRPIEACVRHYCVGPYDPDISIDFGQTGARVIVNQTNLTVGHDPSRHFTYGPYVVPLLFDDFRVCWEGCNIPNGLYGRVGAFAHAEVWVLGSEYSYGWGTARDIGFTQPDTIPDTWGCEYSMYGCP